MVWTDSKLLSSPFRLQITSLNIHRDLQNVETINMRVDSDPRFEL
jgi:hypothetical protein